jgi:hypothetical protein
MVFNATFNNISVILWWSVILVEETGIPKENHRPAACHAIYFHKLHLFNVVAFLRNHNSDELLCLNVLLLFCFRYLGLVMVENITIYIYSPVNENLNLLVRIKFLN